MKFIADYRQKTPEIIKTKIIRGHEYALTGDYLMKDGKPYIYTMGELHFSRVKEEDWEEELIKMKNGGIEIVATYIFWNHHEVKKGTFDFSGNRNLRKFVDTCEKVGMPVFLRIGPWCHGEARRGGFPDWLEKECPNARSTDEKYLFYVDILYREIYNQVGTSRNIFGIQIENEYTDGSEYLRRLYEMAIEIGFDAFLFTATGWNSEIPDCLTSVFGVYPEHPWDGHTRVFEDAGTYGFYPHDADVNWGKHHTADEKRPFPTLTCELGAGNEITYHRRPIIMPREIAALTLIQLGTGCKGLGYYMYHGGVNPIVAESDKIIATFQESRESGYDLDYPVISYDFQSPLGDCGQIRQSYYELKTLLSFVKCEEEKLAPMGSFLDTEAPDKEDLCPVRAGVLSDGESGYLFYMNVYHGHRMPYKQGLAQIQLKDELLLIPLTVPEDNFGIIPFNYRVGDETLKWVRAIPVKKTEDSVTFSVIDGVAPEFMYANGEMGDLRNVKTIGGIKIILTQTERVTQTSGRKFEVKESESCLSFDIFRHIQPAKGTHLTEDTREYVADIPDDINFVSVSAKGNTGAAFEQKNDGTFRIISDMYLMGDEWIVDVRNVSKLRLKIQAFGEKEKESIYLETEFVTGHFIPEVIGFSEKPTIKTPAPLLY